MITRWMGNSNYFLSLVAGEFTINGNGYTITGPPTFGFLNVGGPTAQTPTGATLSLNNVTIRGFGGGNAVIDSASENFIARSVIIRDNTAGTVLSIGGRADLRNVQILDNGPAGGSLPVLVSAGDTLTVSNSVFQGNRVLPNFAIFNAVGAIQIDCQTNAAAADNVYPDGTAANISRVWPSGRFEIGSCPKKKRKEDPTAMPTSTLRPQIAATHVALQAATGATFRATFGLDSGVHFRQLDGAGIGVQSIIDAGYLEAFDVWGYVEQGVEVCFPQVGRVIFLDANTSPRAIVPLASTVANGQTCVSINSPGSLVLLPNG